MDMNLSICQVQDDKAMVHSSCGSVFAVDITGRVTVLTGGGGGDFDPQVCWRVQVDPLVAMIADLKYVPVMRSQKHRQPSLSLWGCPRSDVIIVLMPRDRRGGSGRLCLRADLDSQRVSGRVLLRVVTESQAIKRVTASGDVQYRGRNNGTTFTRQTSLTDTNKEHLETTAGSPLCPKLTDAICLSNASKRARPSQIITEGHDGKRDHRGGYPPPTIAANWINGWATCCMSGLIPSRPGSNCPPAFWMFHAKRSQFPVANGVGSEVQLLLRH
ncbi:hypothetical protein J6590_013285 [Homalodisca vitripennis]|nr:hypothetical protein J6590_013285 [Homalodisca vitripennis]